MITAFPSFQSLLLNSDRNYCKIGQLIYVHIPMKFLKTNRLAGEKNKQHLRKYCFSSLDGTWKGANQIQILFI